MENSTEAQFQQRKGRRVVLFPMPFQGHINPMLQLANILHARGFSITVIHTHFNSLNPSHCPHFTFLTIPDGLSNCQASSLNIITITRLLNVNCVEPFQDCLSRLLLSSQTSEEPVACLVTDVLWHFTQAVANSLQLPRIVLRTNGAASLLVFSTLLSWHQLGCLSTKGAHSCSNVPHHQQCTENARHIIRVPKHTIYKVYFRGGNPNKIKSIRKGY